MTINERVGIRLQETLDSDLLTEITTLAQDRILMRAGIAVYDEEEARTAFPKALESLAVDVSVKIYRRINFEGIASEGADALNTSFVDDILAEYEDEINSYKRNTTRKVAFI